MKTLYCLFLAAILHTSIAQAGAELLLSSDNEGHVGPCQTCPMHVGQGGLARRATVINQNRASGDVLLLDTGNFLFGADSLASKGQIIVVGYNALDYDATNISYRDFRLCKEQTLGLLKQAHFVPISANILDADSGKLLFKPYAVKRVGAVRIAVIGLCEAPAGLEYLPRLQKQLAGIRFQPPDEALAACLPDAAKESDRAVVLYYGSSTGLAKVRAACNESVVAIAVGGLESEPPADGTPLILTAEQHGKTLCRLSLDATAPAKPEQINVTADLIADEKVAAALAAYDGTASPAPVVANPVNPKPIAPATQPSPAAPRVTARQPLEPKGLAGVNLTADQVNAAIDRGRDFLWAYLRARQKIHGNNPTLVDDGADLLTTLALLHAGAREKIPEFDPELRKYLDQSDPRKKQFSVYEAGIYCMLIEDYGDPTYLPKLRDAARYLVELQGPGGSWNYGRYFADVTFFDPPPAAGVHSLQVFGGTPLDADKPIDETLTRITPFAKDTDGDNSNSQFAVLGIRSAARWHLVASPDTWSRNLAAMRERQCPNGSWDYHQATAWGYGSMTCAGICFLAIDRYQLGEKEPAADEQLERGLAWLDQHFTVGTNPEHSGSYLYYYLYSLERVGRILDTEFIGSHEWYPLGARFLVDHQKPSGKWVESSEDEDPRAPTSFALLFLTRATSSLNNDLPRNGSGELRTTLTTAPPSRLYIILDASGSMLDEMDGRLKFDIARDAASAMLGMLPPGAQAALRVYGHRLRSLEPGSDEDTELKISMGAYDPQKFAPVLQALRPRGKTPLALSLTQAMKDLGNSPDATTLVLLTDGGEDTMPRHDPVKVAATLAKLPNITFHIIGFDINQQDWNAQLRAMAEASGGKYWPAPKSTDLNRALRAALMGDPDYFRVVDSTGKEVFRGQFGQAKRLVEGKYELVTPYSGREFRQSFWINTKGTTVVTFDAAAATHDPTAGDIADEANPPPPTPPSVATRFCTNCGKPVPPGAKFCPSCGAKVPVDLR
jgi:hypothetical protein